MMFFSMNERNPDYAKDPAVIRWKDRCLMYYSVPPWSKEDPRRVCGWGIGVAESTDLVHWNYIGELNLKKTGHCAPAARVYDGKIHLFYQAYADQETDAICYASSSDGIHFTGGDAEPVFHPPVCSWSCGRAIDADVIEYKGMRWLYAATRDPEMKIQKLVCASVSAEDENWMKHWKLAYDGSVLEPELPWEQECIEAPATLIHNDRIYLFYGGAYNNAPQQIGCAVSSDGVHFRRLSDTPVLPNGNEGEWNHSESGHPYAFTDDDGQQYLFFQGNSDMGKTWHLTCRKIIWKGDFPTFSEF